MEEENTLIERDATPMEASVTTMYNLSAAIMVQSKLMEILRGDQVPHPSMDGRYLTAEVLLALFADSHDVNEAGEV